MAVKIFDMNGEEWYAAETADEAISCMCELCGFTRSEAEEYCELPLYELVDEDLDHLKFRDDDGVPDGEIVVRTFREQLQLRIDRGDKFPSYFAGTEF